MNERNYTIDYIKLIAALSVVLIHVTAYMSYLYPMTQFEQFINYMVRFAVPFFILSSGYFVRDNMKALISLVKLYVLFLLVYTIADILFLGLFAIETYQAISWYFITMIIILVITNNKHKLWTTALIIAGLCFDFIFGHVAVFEPFMATTIQTNWIKYIWLFLLGRLLYEMGFKLKNKALCVVLYIVGIMLSFANGYLQYEQYSLLPKLIAIVVFVPSLTLKTSMPPAIRNVSIDLFLFHGLYIPFQLLVSTSTPIEYIIYVTMVCVLSIITGSIIRVIDAKLLNGIFY